MLADKEQARLEAEQAAQRHATYEAARSAEEARKQELIAKQQASCKSSCFPKQFSCL